MSVSNGARWAVPASYFSMVLGLAGLANGWRVAARLWGLPAWIGEALTAVSVAVWAVLVVRYAARWIVAREDARAEIAHPILCCFVSLAFVSTMLVGIGIAPYAPRLAQVLCVGGALAALVFGVWRHGGLWRGDRDPKTTTPVLYLPTVAANLVSAIAASALGWPEWGQLFFGAGVLAWFALESVMVARFLNVEPLPLTLRPTLGIQQAPPAVALLAYTSVSIGPPDLVAHMLLGYALVQSLIVLRLLSWIRQPFTLSAWAFSFGATAIATGTMRFAERGGDRAFTTLAPVLFVIANVVVIGLAIASIWWLVKPSPPAAAPSPLPSP